MGSRLIVVAEVLSDDSLEVASGEDEKVVEAVGADSPDEAFREGVRSRRSDGGLDRLDADRGERRVEAGGELGVAVADQETELSPCFVEVGGEVAGGLGHPRPAGAACHAEQVDDAAFDLDHEQDVVAAQQGRSRR